MKRRKSTVIVLSLLVYVTIVSAYLAPRNTQLETKEKIITIVGSYAIVFILWLVLRRKEKIQQRHSHRNDEKDQK